MKHFWLIRHAKTSSPHPGQGDIDRQLNARGRADGERMRHYFSTAAEDPQHCADWLVTSVATRAQQTSRYVAAGFSIAPEQVIAEQALYNSSPDTLLGALRETPADASCVAVVAHNPGMTWLVNELAGDTLELDNLPTFGSALFKVGVEQWADVHLAELVTLMTPKLLASNSRG